MPIFKTYLGRRDGDPLIRDESGKYIQIELEEGSYCVLSPVRSHILEDPKYDKGKYISKRLKDRIQQILDNPNEIYFDVVENLKSVLEERFNDALYNNDAAEAECLREQFSKDYTQAFVRAELSTKEYQQWFNEMLIKLGIKVLEYKG